MESRVTVLESGTRSLESWSLGVESWTFDMEGWSFSLEIGIPLLKKHSVDGYHVLDCCFGKTKSCY